MKKNLILLYTLIASFKLLAQEGEKTNYWQAKIDFLEPLINKSIVARLNYGFDRQLIGIVGGFGGNISEYDNKQFDTYQDNINYRIGFEYQFFLSKKKLNRGFYTGGDCEYGTRTITSKISNESVKGISVITAGVWFGYLWKPFKKVNLLVDFTIVHPRYTFGQIKQVNFKTVATPYKPENLFNFLGPWSVGWRF